MGTIRYYNTFPQTGQFFPQLGRLSNAIFTNGQIAMCSVTFPRVSVTSKSDKCLATKNCVSYRWKMLSMSPQILFIKPNTIFFRVCKTDKITVVSICLSDFESWSAHHTHKYFLFAKLKTCIKHQYSCDFGANI